MKEVIITHYFHSKIQKSIFAQKLQNLNRKI